MKAAVQEPPAESGIELANWNWKVVRQFVAERYGISLSRSSCLNWLHHLGFVLKRPKKRLLKADGAKREAFVADTPPCGRRRTGLEPRYSSPTRPTFVRTPNCGASGCCVGSRPWCDSSSPSYGEKASYYSAVCLETGEVEWMELDGNSNSGTSGCLPGATEGEPHRAADRHLGQRASPPRRVDARIPTDTGFETEAGEPPFSRGQALPGYSPDFNADEAVWGWAREEATGNLCLGTKALVQERVGNFLDGLSSRKDEVKRRCRTVLQSKAQSHRRASQPDSSSPANAHPTLV